MALYSAAVGQARMPEFYEDHGVADTPDGRFDMIMLHVYLLIRRLKDESGTGRDLAQAVFDLMFADMDQNLREMGAGDVGVSIRIKDMAKAFYGRIAAYDAGLAGATDEELAVALRRNLYRKTEVADTAVAAMAAYVRGQSAALTAQNTDELLRGVIDFGNASIDRGKSHA